MRDKSKRKKKGPVEERYQELSLSRQPFLEEARRCAALTIPSLCPPEGMSSGTKLPEPYQSYGALGVKNLAEKVCRALFPPGRAFFRLSLNQYQLEEQVVAMTESINQGQQDINPERQQQFIDEMMRLAQTEIEHKLAAVEQAVMREFELLDNRSTDSEALKHLINDGSVMRYCPQKGDEQPMMYDLNHHVVKRAPDGVVLEQITREGVTALSVDPKVREACGLEVEDGPNGIKQYNLFTQIKRVDKRWEVGQELNGVLVPDSNEAYALDVCPWMALRWTKIDGEDYGRSYVSDYRGTLNTLEQLTRALHEGGIAAARLIGLVNPNSQYGTRLRDIAGAANGDILQGNAQDVTWLRVEKQNDMGWVMQTVQLLARELSRAFLLNSSVQRDAERVTAKEVSAMIQELEGILGGTYAAFGREYQQPILANLMSRMRKAKSLPALPAQVEPTVITGIDAMGRTADLEKLAQFGQFLGMFPPQIVMEYLRFGDIFKQGATAIGIKTDSILRSEQEVEQKRQQAIQQQMMQQAIGPGINALGQQATIAQEQQQAPYAQPQGPPTQ
jgi:hypothetical protein